MFTHCVFFWLDEGADHEDFSHDLRALAALPAVVSATVGTPAATDHQAVDSSYSWGFTVVCRDAVGYEEYANHPQRRAFLDRWVKHFAKVVVYDFVG
jgi:hypothetical protein